MLIGELAEKAGVSTDTIRYYEKIGLLNAENTERLKNNYKNYSDADLEILNLIKQLKTLGLSLESIGSITDQWLKGETNCTPLAQALTAKLPELKAAMALIENKISEITQTLQNCSDSCTFDNVGPSCLSPSCKN